jgi:hypothetical protein
MRDDRGAGVAVRSTPVGGGGVVDIKSVLAAVANQPAPILQLVERGAAEGQDLERALREVRGKLQASLAVVDECLRWMARTQEPGQSAAAAAEFDTVERFMKWAVVKAPEGYDLRAGSLYSLYNAWFDTAVPGWFDKFRSGEAIQGSKRAMAMGEEPFNDKLFGLRLRALGYRKHKRVYVFYEGLRLTDDAVLLGGHLFEGL